jgi:triacylglycerol lipase
MTIIPGFSYTNAAHFAKLSELAYEKSEDTFKKTTRPYGYKDIKYFDQSGAQCYGLEHDDYVVLSFRGTEPTTRNDVPADLNIIHGKDKNGITTGSVHCGFRDEVDTLWPDITEWLEEKGDQQIYTCGHSLGGAMSGIAASRLDGAICYNYGCPRIGTNKWRKSFDKEHKMYRFVNDRDIVPRIPPRWMRYKHAGELHFIDKNGNIKKNPNPLRQLGIGLCNMCKNPLRIAQGIPDHNMGDYREFIENWCNKK